jgi:hypothetical protein
MIYSYEIPDEEDEEINLDQTKEHSYLSNHPSDIYFPSVIDSSLDSKTNPNLYQYKEEDIKLFLKSNKQINNRENFEKSIKDYDVCITHSWNGKNYGPSSNWYDIFEMWYISKRNSFPVDYNGKKIALLFPDCKFPEACLKSILTKYILTNKDIEQLKTDMFFINQPEELIIENTDLVITDGKIPKSMIKCKVLHLQIIATLKEESFKTIKYERLNVYYDPRNNQLIDHYKNTQCIEIRKLEIARIDEPNTFLIEDIRRINFNIFKPNKIDSSRIHKKSEKNKIRYLIYVTPRYRSIINESENFEEIDDILDSIPENHLNKIAQRIKIAQKDLLKYYRDDFKKHNPTKSFSTNLSKLTDEQKLGLIEKGTIHGNGYTPNDIMEDGISSRVKLIIVGLNEENRNFESTILSRAINKGIYLDTEVYNQGDLPIEDIHNIYDVYIFTPARNWTTSRFIPEAIYNKKKIIYTEKAQNQLKINIPLAIRINDSENYLSYLAEDDIYLKPKSKIIHNILK